jgi:hypothetical protein
MRHFEEKAKRTRLATGLLTSSISVKPINKSSNPYGMILAQGFNEPIYTVFIGYIIC